MKPVKTPRNPSDFAVLVRYSRDDQVAYLIDPMFPGSPVARARAHMGLSRRAAVSLMHSLEGQNITTWFKINSDGTVTKAVEPSKRWRDSSDPIDTGPDF